MKKYLCLSVFTCFIVLIVCCKKEVRLQTMDEIITSMKADDDMKELYSASKGWVILTAMEIKKKRLDSSATITYLQNLKSTEQARLSQLGQKIKSKYKLDRYLLEEVREMVTKVFESFIVVEKIHFRKQDEAARLVDPSAPNPMLLPPSPKDCYKWLIADVSACDKAMVVETGLAAIALFAGPFSALLAQTAAFIQHSRCVDNAHVAYKRCVAKTILAVDPNQKNLEDGLIQIYNPENANDYIIIFNTY